jgi:uncharacterized protein (TIGR00369 family)
MGPPSVEHELGTFFLARLLDLDIKYGNETCTVRAPVRDFLFNPQGSLHRGVVATMIDISMGHLLNHIYGAGGATLEMKTQFLRPITSGDVRCEARFLQRGRSIAFLESRLCNDAGKIAAVASSTWKPANAVAVRAGPRVDEMTTAFAQS